MVLSASMSSGRTTPATMSSRTSKLTRISCLPFDDQIPVGQDLRHHGGDVGHQLLGPAHRARALARRVRVGLDQRFRLDAIGQNLGQLPLQPEHVADPEAFAVAARALSLVVELGRVGDPDPNRHDVAGLGRALVLEEGARALAPERVRGERDRLRVGHRHPDRLVARLGGRILDRRQGRGLAETGKAVACAAARERQGRESDGRKGAEAEGHRRGDHRRDSRSRGFKDGAARHWPRRGRAGGR